ncbi:uncharacterized protein LOC110719087 [Chenopodium quinoa]|uniref:uncharacterized protein LOC110719087 n=1 Tax=Chenopodium quinoa TaxID=63459 RepID=UPI000B7776BC|nr:uncharacterized protein LOC110719087 [Chenopodium quinoa]
MYRNKKLGHSFSMDSDHSSSSSSGGDSIVEWDEDSLISVFIKPFLARPFTLEGCKFRPSNTFGDIRAAIVRESRPDLNEFNDPKTDFLQIPGDFGVLEDNWTIESVFKSCCADITISIVPAGLRPGHLTCLIQMSGNTMILIFFTRRPRTEMLPFRAATSLPVFDGPLELKTCGGRPLSIDNLQDFGSLYTSATHVLLTPSSRIWGILSALSDSRYLVVHVSWDRLSYLFLRVIKVFYPDMPFVAVTDLTPHQLELLTFLDTPQLHMNYLYGWDILDEAEEFCVNHIERLDIKWLGLRPSDLERFPADVFDGLALPRPRDFDNVLSKIKWNLHFSRNKAWIRELELFKANQKCVMFQPRGPLKNILFKRLFEMDCV